MPYAIARITKLKGGAVTASDEHGSRQRETPNANQEKSKENKRLVGDERPLREVTDKITAEHGGKPRKDSVECLEYFLGASPEFFDNGKGGTDQKKLDNWVKLNLEFLREEHGTYVLKAYLHLDEKTPHISAYVIPIDPSGKLNCKYFTGDRKKLSAFQDRYAQKMSPLELERGVKGSRAQHQDIKRFYGTIMEKVDLTVERSRIPDPPRILMTEESRKEYKDMVIQATGQQLVPQITTIRNQAQLTLEETRKRKAAEQRLENSERLKRLVLERLTLAQSDNQKLVKGTETLRAELTHEIQRNSELDAVIQRLDDRVRDIPLESVLEAFGYEGEQHEHYTVFHREGESSEIAIANGRAFDKERQLVSTNALDLVQYVRKVNEGVDIPSADILAWMSDVFGKERAVASAVAHTEDVAVRIIDEFEREREAEISAIKHEQMIPELEGQSREYDPFHDRFETYEGHDYDFDH